MVASPTITPLLLMPLAIVSVTPEFAGISVFRLTLPWSPG